MSEARTPKVVVLAGPNGAGKTTASRWIFRGPLSVAHFVNADTIARGLSLFRPESVAAEAGRIMLARLDRLEADRADFAFETTLASRGHAPRLRRLVKAGYAAYLVFLYLPDPRQAVERVAGGGHHVPSDVVARRHDRGLRNFFTLFQGLTNGWYFYNNSEAGAPRLVAAGSARDATLVQDEPLWVTLRSRYEHDATEQPES